MWSIPPGNVGIGTSSPGTKLHVNGTITAAGLKFPTGASNGFILTSSPTGIAFWTDPDSLLPKDDGDWNLNGQNIVSGTQGNVGIGTNHPTRKLHIYKNPPTNGLRVIPGGGSSPATGGNTGIRIEVNAPLNPSKWDIVTNNLGEFYLEDVTMNSKRFFINRNGYVGIGSTNPQTELDVRGTITAQDFRLPQGAQRGFLLTSDHQGNFTWTSPSQFTTPSFWDKTGRNLYPATNLRVGIGVNNPVSKLEVKGNIRASQGQGQFLEIGQNQGTSFIEANGGGKLLINYYSGNDVAFGSGNNRCDIYIAGDLSNCGMIHTKEVEVESGWCDYVFEDGYELMSLEEVEAYIEVEGHLPGIPAAREIEENGLQIAEMERRMMEKIEELTLYLIELKNENAALAEELEGISVANEELRQEIEEAKR